MATRTALFVLGMHRSGTSALTRVLSLLGASLPHRVLPAGVGNEPGHWEPEAAVALHDKMLAAAGTSVNGLAGPADSWFTTSAAEAFLEPMRNLLREEFSDTRLFVFKDPRSTLLFPLWRRVLLELDIECRPIIMLRNPVEVAQSIMERQAKAAAWQSWNMDRGGFLWLRYMLAAERHTRGTSRFFCSYHDLLQGWQCVARRLADELTIEWPRPPADAALDISRFLDIAHRHHRAGQFVAGHGSIWARWIDPTFKALQAACAGDAPDHAALDAVSRSFTDICSAVVPVPEAGAPGSSVSVQEPTPTWHPAMGGQRQLGMVVTGFMLDAPRRSLLSNIIDTAIGSDAGVTVMPVGEIPDTSRQALEALCADKGVPVQVPGRHAQQIEPAFMRGPVELFRYLRAQAFDAILFPDRGGYGHACVTAKLTGAAFSNTTLGVLIYGGSRWQREQDRCFPHDLVTLSIEHIEQKAVEGADLVLSSSAGVTEWMQRAGWRHHDGKPLPGSMPGAAISHSIVSALQSPAGHPAPTAGDTASPCDVTIIITHFEQPRLLDQNLHALMRQSDPGFSVLVIDDGSQSKEALHYLAKVGEAFRTLNLRLIRQPNRYLGAARNAGIRAATTEYVILLDDDNLAFPTMVATLKQAVRTSGADIVTCGLRHFHDAAQPPGNTPASVGHDQVFAAGPLLVGAVHNCFGDASAIYRRSVFDRAGFFHEIRGVTFEDWQMHLQAVAAGFRLLSIPEPLVWYRVRGNSMLRTTNRYDNARVIAGAIRQVPTAMLDPLADFLAGLEEEQCRLNDDVAAIRAVAAASAASQSDLMADTARHCHELEAILAARSDDAEAAARYAQSLEVAVAEAYKSRDEAANYARSLEQARAEAESYARHLEAKLAEAMAAATTETPRPEGTPGG